MDGEYILSLSLVELNFFYVCVVINEGAKGHQIHYTWKFG